MYKMLNPRDHKEPFKSCGVQLFNVHLQQHALYISPPFLHSRSGRGSIG